MSVTRTWLRDDEVECVRCRRWAGLQDETCYVVKGEGVVCVECITAVEEAQAG